MMRSRSTSVKTLSPEEVRDENVDPLFMVWLVSRSTNDLLDTLFGPVDLTGNEFAIYSVLAASPDMTPTELARWMAAPATTVSSYLKRFESRGHILREPNPDDRRSFRIQLTPAGRRAHDAAVTLFRPIRAQVDAALAKDDGDVREALLRLRTVVDDLRHSASEPTRVETTNGDAHLEAAMSQQQVQVGRRENRPNTS